MSYIVKQGDTLESIATEQLGDESLAQYLASINNIQGVPGFAGGWVYPISAGQVLETGTPEVTAKKWPKGLIIAGVLAAAAGMYYRKDIVAFFEKLI